MIPCSMSPIIHVFLFLFLLPGTTTSSFTPLMEAAQLGNVNGIESEHLLYVGEVDEELMTALTYATFNNNELTSTTIVNMLIQAGEDMNHADKNGYTPVLWAAQNDNLGAAKALVAAGANVNPRSTEQKLTPLLSAVASGHKEMIKYLVLDAKVNLNAKTVKHITALISAVSGGDKNLDLVQMLLNHGANADAKTIDLGIASLHLASQEGHHKLVGALLKGGATVDIQNNMLATPLMMAVLKNHSKIVGLLLAEGADPSASIRVDDDVDEDEEADDHDYDQEDEDNSPKSYQTITPITMAASAGHREISDLLDRYMDL